MSALELALPLLLVVHEAQHGKAKQRNQEGGQEIDIALEDGLALAGKHRVLGDVEHDDEDDSDQYGDGDSPDDTKPDCRR